jgi:hypothetical protein
MTTSSIFQGIAPPNVTTTGTSQTIAPTQYLDFLSGLGQAGQTALNAPSSSLVAPLSTLQNSVYGTDQGQQNTQSLLTGALNPINAGATTAANAATGLSQDQINAFYNPNVNAVNTALETATTNNVNNTVLPGLQSFFAGSGNTGSTRALNATGQTLANIQTGLGATEAQNNQTAYNNAVTNALTQQSNLGNIANIQGNIGNTLMNSTVSGLNEASSLGAQNQAQQQAIINAPLNQATNVSALLRGYTIPTATDTTQTGPANSYAASPLAQIAGLGTLFAGGNNSAVSGIKSLLSGVGGSGIFNADGSINLGGGVGYDTSGNITGGSGPSADQPSNADLEAQWGLLGNNNNSGDQSSSGDQVTMSNADGST